jgi:hypothetical protein
MEVNPMRVVLAALLLVLAPAALRGEQQPVPPPPGVPAQPPAAPATTPRSEPGATPAAASSSVRTFTTPAGMIVNAVRPERVADFEKVIGYLQEALSLSTNATVQAQAQGWRVMKASEPGPNGTVLYVFLFDPAVSGADYGLGRILAEGIPEQTKLQEVWKLYTDSLASGGSLLSLTPVQPAAPAGSSPAAAPPAAAVPQP